MKKEGGRTTPFFSEWWFMLGVALIMFSSSPYFWETNIFALLTFLILAIGVIWRVYGHLRTKWQQGHLFTLMFPPSSFPLPDIQEWAEVKKIGLGKQQIFIGVMVKVPLKIERFDIRVTSSTGERVHPLPFVIEGVNDTQLSGKLGEIYKLQVVPYEGGRIEGYYVPPLPRRKEEALYLCLQVDAKEQGDAYVSFRGYDNEGKGRISRGLIQVLKNAPCA